MFQCIANDDRISIKGKSWFVRVSLLSLRCDNEAQAPDF